MGRNAQLPPSLPLPQVAQFLTSSPQDCTKALRSLNAMLPNDLTVTAVQHVPLDFNVRYSLRQANEKWFLRSRPSGAAPLAPRLCQVLSQAWKAASSLKPCRRGGMPELTPMCGIALQEDLPLRYPHTASCGPFHGPF